MIVILDTTETFQDLRMEGPLFRLLQSYLIRTSSELLIPRVVFEETVNHFREKLSKHLRDANDELTQLAKLTGDEIKVGLPMSNESELIEKFTKHLESRIQLLQGKVLDYEHVSLKRLVHRSLARRRPFDGEGRKGFRDAVLWESVLHELGRKSGDANIALITRNSNDFGKNGALHKSLVEDCRVFGDAKKIQIFNGLRTFIVQEVNPKLETLDVYDQISEGTYKDFSIEDSIVSIANEIRSKIRENVRRLDLQSRITRLAGSLRSQDLISLKQKPTDVEVSDVWSIEDNLYAVGVEFTQCGEIEYEVAHEELWPEGDEVISELVSRNFIVNAVFRVSVIFIISASTGEGIEEEVVSVDIVGIDNWSTL